MSPIANTFRRLWREEHGWGRIWTGLGIAIALAGGGLVYQQVIDTAPAAGTANLWVDTNGGTCTRHSTATTYVDADACASLDAARDAAQCGDMVEIRAGDYAAFQDMSSPANGCTSDPVTLQVMTGEADFDLVSMDSPGTTLRNITIPNDADPWPGGADASRRLNFELNCNTCALYDSTIRTMNVWGSDNVIVEGNTIDARGPNGNWTDSSIEVQDTLLNTSPYYDGGSNIVFRNNNIRDFFTGLSAPDDHGECLNIGGWTDGFLAEGNTFDNCGRTSLVFFTYFGHSNLCDGGSANPPNFPCVDPATTYPRNVCFRNNTLGSPIAPQTVVFNFRDEVIAVGPNGSDVANIRIDPDQAGADATTNPEFNLDC